MIVKVQDLSISDFVYQDISEKYLRWLNDKQHLQYSRQSEFQHDFESSRKYVDQFANSNNRFFSIKKNEELIGTATLYLNGSSLTGSCGIMLGKEYSGQGYGKLAWYALINSVAKSLNVKKVTAGMLSVNKPMITLCQSAGMDLESVLKGEGFFQGIPTDILLFSRVL